MIDACARQIDYIRISITDRCNLRCVYCMPDGGVTSFEHQEILTYEEIVRLVRLLAQLGIRHVRVTGGEPMARLGCLGLVDSLSRVPGIETLSMTTNALLLDGRVREARDAGLSALNISLDTLDPEVYRRMTRGGDVSRALSVIDEALALGMRVKINAVPVGGMNEEGLADLAALARDRNLCVRFIELMPVGCGASLEPVSTETVRARLTEAFGELREDTLKHGFGPARYARPEGFRGSIGFISPMSHEFCDQCNRVRLTADGFLKLCLNHRAGIDLRGMLRAGAGDEELLTAMREAIYRKPTRHGFESEIDDREVRRMNEIGG